MHRLLIAALAGISLFAVAACDQNPDALSATTAGTSLPTTETSDTSDTGDPLTASTPPGVDDRIPLANRLAGRAFISSTVDGHVLVDGTQIRLAFQRDSVNVSAGCNTLGGAAAYDGETLIVDDMMQTEMGCEPDREAQDLWLGALFKARPTLQLEGDTLTVTSSEIVIAFVDAATADPALPLVGTTWNLDTTISGDAASSVPINSAASITITDGSAAVHTGCNRGSAGVEITDNTITFAPMATTKMACEQPLMDLEFFVTSVMTGQVSYAIEANRLTLTQNPTGSDDGETIGLVFVAQ